MGLEGEKGVSYDARMTVVFQFSKSKIQISGQESMQ